MIDLKSYPSAVLSAGHLEPFLFGGWPVKFHVWAGGQCFITFDHTSDRYIYLKDSATRFAVMSRKELMMLIVESKYTISC